MYIEYKLGDGPWQADEHHVCDEDGCLRDVDSSHRDYELFGVLAEVRNSVDNDAEPKGLPDDVSETIKSESDRWDCDGHSHSYSSLEEFKDALKKCDLFKVRGVEPIAFYYHYDDVTKHYGYANILAYCKSQIKKFKIELEAEKYLLGQNINTEVQCRLVYFFDN
jgi:hypothetical protein